MSQTTYTPDEISRRGEELYEREVRSKVEQGNEGKYLVIDIETGDYEVGDDYLALSHRAHARRPEAVLYAKRIGYPAIGRLGGRFQAARS